MKIENTTIKASDGYPKTPDFQAHAQTCLAQQLLEIAQTIIKSMPK